MINAEQILAAAREQTQLEHIGDESMLIGLNEFTRALNTEAPLSESGRGRLQRVLTNLLANRLRVESYLAQHPEVLERPIDKPMFVFGLPRTGTTLAINLLNTDPARRSLLRWEAMNSVPPPRAGELRSDPRYVKEQAAINYSVQHAPHISAIHHEDADSPTECQFVMAQSFCAQYLEAIVDVPSYRKWWLQADYLPAFRYHKRLLQLLQSEAPGRWTLKNPWHALYLDDLTAVYPDAQLVMTHRDPVDVVASYCSLIKNVRLMFSDTIDARGIGATAVDTFDKMIERSLAWRRQHGWGSIYDVQYADLMRDPIGEMRKLYQRFDEPWSATVESAMRSHLERNPQGRHGRHEYSLEEYGLSRELIEEHFDGYCRQFEIARKAAPRRNPSQADLSLEPAAAKRE